MPTLTVYHNPGCSHSRGALQLLNERGIECDVIEYLKTPPSRETLEKILAMLEDSATELVRKDKRFAELGLKADDYVDKKQIVALLLEHPELMQRPIVIRGNRAIIARPPEKLTALL
jgi:arsenate reductase (glutaredoxin)